MYQNKSDIKEEYPQSFSSCIIPSTDMLQTNTGHSGDKSGGCCSGNMAISLLKAMGPQQPQP